MDGAEFCGNPGCGGYLRWGGPAGTVAPTPRPRAHTSGGLVTLVPAELAVTPGTTATVTATVFNGGSLVEQFAIRGDGAAAGWMTCEPSTLQVYPGESASCALRFTPPRFGCPPAGRIPFTVRAISAVNPALAVAGTGFVNLAAARELTATLTPQRATGRGRTRHAIELVNAGNVAEPLRIRADDPTARIRFQLPAGDVSLPPGRHVIPLSVRPPRNVFGRPVAQVFQVTITPVPPSAPLRLHGTREVRPLVARWAAALMIVLLAAGAAALALVPGSPLRHAHPVAAGTTPADPTLAPSVTPRHSPTAGTITGRSAGAGSISPSVSPADPTLAPPTVPSHLRAATVTTSSVKLTWSASTAAHATVNLYLIYRNGSLVEGVDTTSFTDHGLHSARSYRYTVVAVDSAGDKSAPSAELRVVTAPDVGSSPVPSDPPGSPGGGGGGGGGPPSAPGVIH